MQPVSLRCSINCSEVKRPSFRPQTVQMKDSNGSFVNDCVEQQNLRFYLVRIMKKMISLTIAERYIPRILSLPLKPEARGFEGVNF